MGTKWSVLLLVFLLAGNSSSQTVVDAGTVHGTWTAANAPYLINGDITIPDDSTLIIEPGVLVEFQRHAGLWVQGRLSAEGTESDSIIFTVADTSGFSLPDTSGGWYGIRFVDTPLDNDSSRLAYCRLEYGKAIGEVWYLNSGGAILAVNFGKISIIHCLFRHNHAGGPELGAPAGGALHLNAADIVLRESVFQYNSALSNGGAIYCVQSDPVIRRSLFSHNTARDGGAVMGSYTDLTISDCTFEYNQAAGFGAALSLDSCRVLLAKSTLYNNTAGEWGGGMHTYRCELDLRDCLFLANEAAGLGGGIHADFSTLTGRNVSFIGNHSDVSGGVHSWYTDLQLRDCRFEQNTAENSGAGIHADYSRLTIDSTLFYDNQAGWGAALQVYNADLLLGSCRFTQNIANNGNGGAIHYRADSTIFPGRYTVQIGKTDFTANTASGAGAGVFIEQVDSDTALAEVSVDRCLFSGNHASRFSPLRVSGPFSGVSLTNSLFHHNTSSQWAAGPALVLGASGTVANCVSTFNYANYSDSTASASAATLNNDATAFFINCVFADTSGSEGYGLSVGNGSNATVINTIIWGCGTRPVHPSSSTAVGSEVSLYHCNIEHGTDSLYTTDSVSAIHYGDGNIALDPLFAGLVQGDLRLQNESPMIGAGVGCLLVGDIQYCAPAVDIEGKPRPSPEGSHPDIGAYENILGIPAAVVNSVSRLPRPDQLYQNYPNPFNPVTIIGYELSAASRIQLIIYNMLGQKVATLVDARQPAGPHRVEWHAHDFASGVYLYRMSTDIGYSETRKLLLLR